MRGLADLCGIGVQATKYKPLRDRQIQSSEEYVQRIMGILNGRFLNRLAAEVDKDESVYNLSSGMPSHGNTEGLLEIKKTARSCITISKKSVYTEPKLPLMLKYLNRNQLCSVTQEVKQNERKITPPKSSKPILISLASF